MKRIIKIPLFFSFFILMACYNEALAVSVTVGGVRVNKAGVKNMKEIKSQHIVHQSLDFSCGAAGLSTIFNYYLGDPVSEKEIISTIFRSVDMKKVRERRGFSLLDLKKFAEAKGYKVTGYKMDPEFLTGLKKPVLVPIKFKNYQHFVIVKGVIGDRVFLSDPAVGNMTMKISRFEGIWLGGVGLVIEHEDEQNKEYYSLSRAQEEALYADYKSALTAIQGATYRTAIFVNEY